MVTLATLVGARRNVLVILGIKVDERPFTTFKPSGESPERFVLEPKVEDRITIVGTSRNGLLDTRSDPLVFKQKAIAVSKRRHQPVTAGIKVTYGFYPIIDKVKVPTVADGQIGALI